MVFNGLCTALITPFRDGKIDFDAFEKLVEYQLANGVDALLFLGTTGEPATMSAEEKQAVIKFGIEVVRKRVPVMIGAGSNCTASTVENAIMAERLGADSLLVVTPYYNKCTQGGLYQHYKAVCEAVNVPVVCYNVPGRTGVNILPETALKLSAIPNMEAIKEASGNVAQISETARLIQNRMSLLSGDDGLALPIFSLGAQGLISVVSNVAPALTAKLVDCWFSGDIEGAKAAQFELAPLINAIFCEVNPIPAKYAASVLGICSEEVRLPLTNASDTTRNTIDTLLREMKITL